MKTIILMIFLSVFLSSHASEYSCLDDYLWVKKTFEENDAGFDYALSIKGKQAYENNNATILTKVKTAKDSQSCTKILYQWLTFFRKGHIAIRRTNQTQSTATHEPSKEDLQQRYKDWEKVNIDEKTFKNYLKNNKILSPFEGIWSSPPYTIGIKRINKQLLGFIIDVQSNYWSKGQVKLKMNNDATQSTFYMRDHSAVKSDDIVLQKNKYLKIGSINLKKVYPQVDDDKNIERYFKLMQSKQAIVEKISDTTVLLRIPSFAFSQKKQIDQVIKDHKQLITSTKNLIIDISYNGGGSDSSYAEIIPLIYTNPIRTIGVEMLSSKLNNQRMQSFIDNPDWSDEDKKWAKDSLKKLNKHLGQFVDINNVIVSVKKLDKIYKNPQNVAILINQGNASTSEQFLLAAKQSRKVKLYGTTTAGILDVSNMNFVPSPDGGFELGYALSKSHRIPDMAIDNKGILPDFYLDKSISNSQWINFVQNILEH